MKALDQMSQFKITNPFEPKANDKPVALEGILKDIDKLSLESNKAKPAEGAKVF